ncbi:MAG: glycine--tRNA ligase subunit beta, partial [Olsenella sp.]|nr:glycine--tRNA ligase subunit beta [Olsenella sp.]
RRAAALDRARSESPELFEDLATAYARAAHLADASLGTDVDASILGDAEKALLSACEEGERKVSGALTSGDFDAACEALAGLRGPIDRFFTDVLVMDPDPSVKDNRLRLLNRFAGVFGDVADIGVLSKRK